MSKDDEFQTTLSKWPFIVGDVLLVGTALAIAILGNWQLGALQIAACVVSVALGACLFVLPYVVEFRVRIREESEDRAGDLRLLQRHIGATQDEVAALSDRLEAFDAGLRGLLEGASKADRALSDFDQKIAVIDTSHAQVSEQLNQLGTQLGDINKRIDVAHAALQTKLEADAIEGLQGEIQSFRAQMDGLRGAFKALEKSAPPVGQSAQVEADETPQSVEPPKKAPERSETIESVAKRKKNRAPRQRNHPEPRLLKRAIDEKSDHSSAAVSRIIQSRGKEPVIEPSEPEEPPVKSDIASEPESAPELLSEGEFRDPILDTTDTTDATDATDATEIAETATEESSDNERVESSSNPAGDDSISATAEHEAEELEAAAETPDMFADSVPAESRRRARRKKSDTAVLASVFIGIGNKPFLRGSGAGLNWLSGVPMEFEEIGKWRWIAPAEMDGPVELQIYRNDEDPDHSGKHSLEPGQQLEISPDFA